MACLLRVIPLLFLPWSPHCKRLTPYSSTGYSFQNDVQRVIIHANDITMFVLCSHNSQGSSGTVGERTSPAYPWNCSTSRTLTDVSALETSDEDQHTVITADVVDQAQDLLTSGYTNKADDLKNQAWKNCESTNSLTNQLYWRYFPPLRIPCFTTSSVLYWQLPLIRVHTLTGHRLPPYE